MSELIDIVDGNNRPTGQKSSRSQVHSDGSWHRTVHIYLYRNVANSLELLIHLRSKTKDLKPDRWDTRFGGHVKAGESVEETVAKELEEEVGLGVDSKDLIAGQVYKSETFPNNEFNYTYFYQFLGDISTLRFNDGEVQEIKWMSVDAIEKSMVTAPDKWAGKPKGLKIVASALEEVL